MEDISGHSIDSSPCCFMGEGRRVGERDGRNKSQNNHFILERSAAITDSAVNEASGEKETDRPRTFGQGAMYK